MAKIPLKYNLRNLVVRWRSTLMTALSIGLVVAVFIIIMSLARGLNSAFFQSGNPLNILVLRKGATAEMTSWVSKENYQIIKYFPGIETDSEGQPLAATELLVIMNLEKLEPGNISNVLIRGVSPESFSLRSQVRLAKGTIFQKGLRQVIVSKSLALRFRNMNIGDTVKIGKARWKVVGQFDAGQSAFGSEVWGDINEIGDAFDRTEYSTAVLRAKDDDSAQRLIKRINDEPRMSLKAQLEKDYYAEQTKTSMPIQAFGFFLAIVMSIGAVFAAINTMYASVANRTREIGTLRVLGFTPFNILLSFILESIFLSLIGGVLGCLFSLPINGLTTGTVNFETFSEVIFNFRVTPGLLLEGMIFSLIIGFTGGLIPAWSASRRPVISALRELE